MFTTKKWWIILVVLLASFLQMHVVVRAAESKEITVRIEEKYEAVKISLQFDHEITCNAFLLDPRDNVYMVSTMPSPDTMVFLVESPEKGEWRVNVDSTDPIGDVNLSVIPIDKSELSTDLKEKNINFSIEKGYASAKFIMRPETVITGSVVLEDSQKNTFMTTLTDEGTYECLINNVKKGNWKIRVTSTKEIGKVDVQIEGYTEEAKGLNSNVKIATEIVGLQIYYKDNSLVVEWTDESCGNVMVRISNAATLQVLEKATVKENFFEYEIPVDVDEILVYIVPSTSANIKGAGVQYTMKVDNHPDGDLVFEDRSVTNCIETIVTAHLRDDLGVLIYANDKIVEETGILSPGDYDFHLPVVPGSNTYKGYIIDKKHNMRSTDYSLIGDMVAPDLTVNHSSKTLTLAKPEYKIMGTVKDYTSLTVNGKLVENIYDDNTFEYDYHLREGNNQICVLAKDDAGNETELSLLVIYDKNLALMRLLVVLIIVVICVIIVLVILLAYSNKRNKQEMQENEKLSLDHEEGEWTADYEEEDEYEDDEYEDEEETPTNLFLYIKWKKEKKRKMEEAVPKSAYQENKMQNTPKEDVPSHLEPVGQDAIRVNKNDPPKIRKKEHANDNREGNAKQNRTFTQSSMEKKSRIIIRKRRKQEASPVVQQEMEPEEENIIPAPPKVDLIGKYNFLISGGILFATVYLVLSCFLSLNVISSASMEPTLRVGDIVVFNRLAYIKGEVKHGDIILFKSDEYKETISKRVIGIPRDVIAFKDGYVVRNGEYLDESDYIAYDAETNSDKEFIVPNDCYFVLGDNRENSIDSRYMANSYISKEDIIGKYIGYAGLNIEKLLK